MLCKLSYWAPELHGSVATWPSLRIYALQTELLGSGALRTFRLPSFGKARVALMRIYGELERIA